MTRRTELHYFDDMIEAGERAIRHLGSLDLVGLMADELRSDAIVRTLEIVGEACKRVSGPVKTRFPGVPWRQIAGMRDRLIHRYDEVNWSVVWEAVTVHLPAALTELRTARAILEAEELPPPEAP